MPTSLRSESMYDPLSEILQDFQVERLDTPLCLSGSLDLAFDDIFHQELEDALDCGQHLQKSSTEMVPQRSSPCYNLPVTQNFTLEHSIVHPVSNPTLIAVSKPPPAIPEVVSQSNQDDGLSYEYVDNNYIADPTQEQVAKCNPNALYFRWSVIPPERVHATSPSKLVESPRYGTPFMFAVQLVSQCTNGKFIPYKAQSDIPIIAHIYGKRKPKTGVKSTDKPSALVKLELNPVGKPLMVSESAITIPGVRTVIKHGESCATFDGVSLTCGSNAARSQTAPAAARVWDWDYYIKVEPASDHFSIAPVVSKHITTDSNRSQTREKKKREPLPDLVKPAKKRPYIPSQLVDNFQPIPVQSYTKVFSPFKSDLYDFTASPQNVC